MTMGDLYKVVRRFYELSLSDGRLLFLCGHRLYACALVHKFVQHIQYLMFLFPEQWLEGSVREMGVVPAMTLVLKK